MEAPTQELPPWLSYSTTVYTDASGSAFTTSSSLVYLPLTYYGPSIPLGSLFTYGGLTSPASSESTLTPSTVPVTQPPTTTAAPPSPSPSASSPAIPSEPTAIPPTTLMSSGITIPPPSTPLSSFVTATSPTAIPPTTLMSSGITIPPPLSSFVTATSPTAIPPTTLMSSAISIPPPSTPPLPSSVTATSPPSIIPTSSLSSPSSLATTMSSVTGVPPSTISTSGSSAPSVTSLSSTITSPPPLSSMKSSSPHLPSASTTITAGPLPPPPSSFSNANRNAIVAIVLGAILGSVFLLLIALLCLRWRVRRNRNQQLAEFGFETPVWADWMIVDPERDGLQRVRGPDQGDGEGSPRESGDEIDPFLTHRASARPESPEDEPLAGPSVRMVRPDSPIGRAHRSRAVDDDDSSGSDYGHLIERFPSTTVGGPYGPIIQPEDLLKLDNEPGPSGTTSYTPLSPPPPIDPDRIVGFGTIPPMSAQKPSGRSLASDFADAGEAGTLLTARRVRVQEMGLRPRAQLSTGPPPGPSSSRGFGAGLGMGLGALAGLRRLSWLRNAGSSSRPSSSYIAHPLDDKELDAGRALLGVGSRTSLHELGTGPDGARPISSISAVSNGAASGNSLYFDAPSSLPETAEIAPLPRALTPSSPAHQSRPTSWVDMPMEPPPYQYEHILDMHSPTQTSLSLTHPINMDILDIPAPPPASPFGSASPWGSSSSSRGSMGNLPFAPGLAFLTSPRPWQELTDSSPSYRASAANSEGIAFDVLEDDPPAAADQWRTLAGVPEGTRRTTFGSPQIVHQHDPTTSQQGSLHSISQHLGSRPGSGFHPLSASEGSASSRPSAHSGLRTMNSGNSRGSFAQGSITSEGRRRQSQTDPHSPATSAFGFARPLNERGYLSPYPSPPRSPVALRPVRESEGRDTATRPLSGPSETHNDQRDVLETVQES